MKTIILNGFTNEELNELIDYYRRNRKLPKKVIFASVTKRSKSMKLGKLLKELEKDYNTLNK